MTGRKTALSIFITLFSIGAIHAFGDGKDKKVRQNITSVHYYTVPEFYFYVPKKHNDTTWEFLAYDHRDSLIPVVENYDSVRYFSLFKSYTDSAHTYKDDDGTKKLLPVSSIIKRYDRISGNKWMTIEYPDNKYAELTDHKDIIVRTDSVPDKAVLKVFRYYKVVVKKY